NCRSLGNKLQHLSILLALYKPDVICLQETRLEDHPDPPQLKHYHSYRRYDGHGTAIYIHKSLPQTEVVLNSTLEATACRVKFGNTYLSICSIYCPPRGPLDGDALTSLIQRLPGRKLILGDFNAHHCQWGSLRSDGRGEQIANLISQSNLCLLNDGRATRV
ncbi:endonuclease/exonuclease/phosphatase family protein, partial [Klebsiella pneumoniae]|uniref:endonuclease/exonuclease/phosphatase family protein n=1 Tax=Klebsiella pneumoniae TaxID=573 RepID=UPI003EC11BC2